MWGNCLVYWEHNHSGKGLLSGESLSLGLVGHCGIPGWQSTAVDCGGKHTVTCMWYCEGSIQYDIVVYSNIYMNESTKHEQNARKCDTTELASPWWPEAGGVHGRKHSCPTLPVVHLSLLVRWYGALHSLHHLGRLVLNNNNNNKVCCSPVEKLFFSFPYI